MLSAHVESLSGFLLSNSIFRLQITNNLLRYSYEYNFDRNYLNCHISNIHWKTEKKKKKKMMTKENEKLPPFFAITNVHYTLNTQAAVRCISQHKTLPNFLIYIKLITSLRWEHNKNTLNLPPQLSLLPPHQPTPHTPKKFCSYFPVNNFLVVVSVEVMQCISTSWMLMSQNRKKSVKHNRKLCETSRLFRPFVLFFSTHTRI